MNTVSLLISRFGVGIIEAFVITAISIIIAYVWRGIVVRKQEKKRKDPALKNAVNYHNNDSEPE